MHASLAFSRPVHTWRWTPWLGLAAWLGFVGLAPGWPAALFLLAPLVQVPLALRILTPPTPAWRQLVFAWSPVLGLPAALLLLPAFLLEESWTAAAFALPWWSLTVALAVVGFTAPDWQRNLGERVGLAYLTVGASWLLLARAGLRPLNFEPIIVLATAVHFHYAGFILPVLAQKITGKKPSRFGDLLVIGILLGVPLVAAGITLSAFGSRAVELVAVLFMTLVCLALAWQQASLARQEIHPGRRHLWNISSAALALAMILAATYALGTFTGANWLEIPRMVRYHGAVQALGFSWPALVAWQRMPR